MNTKKITTLFCFLFFVIVIDAQEVSTLVNDPGRRFEAIHWHPDGRIYSVDYYNGRLYQIQLDGSVETVLSGFNNLAGGGFDNDNNFYFSDISLGNLHRLNDDDTHEIIASGLNQPVGVLQSADPDILYVVGYGNSSISKVSISDGTVTPWVSSNGLAGPDGLALHDSGDLLVANFNNNRIHRVSEDGMVSLFATLPSTGFMGYLTKANGYVYVPSIAGNRVFRVDMEGNVESFAGTGSTGNLDGPIADATFTDPNGITSNATGDSILVADENHIRLITGFAPVSVKEATLFSSIQLFPNPVQDVLQVQVKAKDTGMLTYEVMDIKGVVQASAKIDYIANEPYLFQLNTKSLARGNYIIRWYDKLGNMQSIPFVRQ